MADYKRMVSYMYQYENGVKRKNVGYARVEAKNGQCKITLHMQLLGQLDSIFPTYLIQRDGNSLDLIYLGDTVLKNQVMDSKLSANEANIMNSGHSLSEMGGMLLFLNDNVFFATEWDDKPIVAKEVLEALKPKKQKNKDTRSEIPEVRPSDSYYAKDEVVEQAPAAEVMGNTAEFRRQEEFDNIQDMSEEQQELYSQQEMSENWQEYNNPENRYTSQQELNDQQESNEQDGSNSGSVSENEVNEENTTSGQELFNSSEGISFDEEVQGDNKSNVDETEELFDYYSAQQLSLEEELKLPKYKLPRGWKTIERLHRTPLSTEDQVLEAADLESPEARQANAERYDQEQHLEIQQNLFGEFLEQLQENSEFQLEPGQYGDQVLDSLYGNEDNSAYNGMNDNMMNEYFGGNNFYEDNSYQLEPSVGSSPEFEENLSGTPEEDLEMPLIPGTPITSGEPMEPATPEEVMPEVPGEEVMPEMPEEEVMPEMPEEEVMPEVPEEEVMPEVPEEEIIPEIPEEEVIPEIPGEEIMPEVPEMPEEPVVVPTKEPEQEKGKVTKPQPGEGRRVKEPETMPGPEGEEEAEHPTAKHFFDHYPRIYPFEDNEIIFCVKIEPKDIGMLPKEIWPLSNNSFLMHGFYCYHHLIFAKLKNRNGTYYILGIPGIYHNRERFMAKMFGFENFKSIRKRDLRQGDFGYWYLPIIF